MIFRKSFVFTVLFIALYALVISPVKASESANVKNREQMREQVSREVVKQIRQDAEQKRTEAREEFKVRLSELKDQRKAILVSKISERIDTINDKWINTWSSALDRMTALLSKVETRSNSLNNEGYDTKELEDAIEVAKISLTEAKDALEVQSAKEYTIVITDETNLRDDVSQVVKTLRNDLQIVRDLINASRADIKEAISVLIRISQSNHE